MLIHIDTINTVSTQAVDFYLALYLQIYVNIYQTIDDNFYLPWLSGEKGWIPALSVDVCLQSLVRFLVDP